MIALQISPELFANIFPVVIIFLVIIAEHVNGQLVNAAKRTESHNIMVKVVICRLHVMENHVKMVVHVKAILKQMVLRSVS